ncbi:MAG: hypothetical protein HOJ79_02255 [Nitrospina sp.]|nr:hypothetical protein [Nitrospina sp.]
MHTSVRIRRSWMQVEVLHCPTPLGCARVPIEIKFFMIAFLSSISTFIESKARAAKAGRKIKFLNDYLTRSFENAIAGGCKKVASAMPYRDGASHYGTASGTRMGLAQFSWYFFSMR